MTDTNKRPEYVSMWVSEKVKREFELAKTNESLQEDIIRRFFTNEREWLEDEIKQVEESTVKYKAMLLKVRDSFNLEQDKYIEDIEKVVGKADLTIKKLDKMVSGLDDKIKTTGNGLAEMCKKFEYVNTHNLERLMEAVDKWNSYSEDQKELIKMLAVK
jgi:hypothetical protein